MTIFLAPALGARTGASLPAPLAWLPRFLFFKLMLMSGVVRQPTETPTHRAPPRLRVVCRHRAFGACTQPETASARRTTLTGEAPGGVPDLAPAHGPPLPLRDAVHPDARSVARRPVLKCDAAPAITAATAAATAAAA